MPVFAKAQTPKYREYNFPVGQSRTLQSRFPIERICSRGYKQKQEFSNVIGWLDSERF